MLEYIAVGVGANGAQQSGGSGIAAYCDRCLVACVEDITPIHAEAEQLADLLNRFQASLVHFRDIIEDYVAER